ncbi:cytochrome c oxidase assembly protein COX19-like isoform X2 [Montipora capricornis]|uniref:cytochrome c oxidase assembly protein COX19-like isoform X2 n=1 Tax=Montipora foliosa TaxID=591990 RepID=UPI0035F214DF
MNPSGRKIFQTKPPDKGSFPLDHDGECKEYMKRYMNCLKKNNSDYHLCRSESKDYLQCRMERQLMAKEDFGRLGFKDSVSNNTTVNFTEHSAD